MCLYRRLAAVGLPLSPHGFPVGQDPLHGPEVGLTIRRRLSKQNLCPPPDGGQRLDDLGRFGPASRPSLSLAYGGHGR